MSAENDPSDAGIDALPQPLARVRADLQRAAGDLRAEHAAAFAVLEVGVRWLAICLLQARAALQAPLDETKRVELFFRRPSFGSWVEVLLRHGRNPIAGVSGANAVLSVIGSLLALESPVAGRLHQTIRSGAVADGTISRAWGALLELLPSYRNDFIGHAGILPDEHYEQYSPLFCDAANDLLDTLRAHPFLLRIAHPVDGAVEVRDCTGIEMTAVERLAAPASGSQTGVPYIADGTTGAPLLSLGNLLHAEDGVLQLFDRSPPRGGIDYMDFATGNRNRVRGQSITDSELVHALSYQEDDQRAIAGRVQVEYQALRRAARVGDRVPFRIAITSQAPTDLRCQIGLETDEGWRQHGSVDEVTVRRGSCSTALLWFEPLSPGVIEGPRIVIAAEFGSGTTQLLQVERPVVRIESSPAQPLIGIQSTCQGVYAPLFDSGKPAVVAVLGESGCGKSTILDEVAREARHRGLRELRATATRDTGQELKPFNDLLRDLLGIVEAEHDAASLRAFATERLSQYLGDEAPVIDYFVDQLLGVDPERFDPGIREYRWFRLLAVTAAEGPLLLIVDDIDQADETSLQLLRSLLKRCHQDGVVVSAVVSTSSAAAIDKLASAQIPIPGFDREGLAELIEQLYPGTTCGDDMPWLADALLERSAGNAAFALSLARQLGPDDDDSLFRQDETGNWGLRRVLSKDLLLAALPVQLADSLAQRIDALPETATEVLEFAGLLGQEVPVAVLERVVEDADALDDGLDRLEVEQVIEAVDPSLTRYRFVSAQVPDLVAERVRGKGRRALRRRYHELATALQSELGGKPQHARQLGTVFAAAGRADEAFPYLLDALLHNARQGHNAAGMSVLDQLREVRTNCEDLPMSTRVEYHRYAALLLAQLGVAKLEEAVKHMERALELATESQKEEERCRCLVKLGEFEIRRSRLTAAEEYLNAAFAILPEASQTAYAARNTLGVLRVHQGRREEAREIFEALLEDKATSSEEPHLRQNLGKVNYFLRRFDDAEKYFRQAIEIARKLDNPILLTVASVGVSNTNFMRGDFQSARDDYEAALEVYRTRQNRPGLAQCYSNLARAESLLGHIDEALRAQRRAIEISEEVGRDQLAANTYLDRMPLQAAIGELDAAAGSLQRACDIAKKLADENLQQRCGLYENALRLWRGETPKEISAAIANTDIDSDDLVYMQTILGLEMQRLQPSDDREKTLERAERMLAVTNPCPNFAEYCHLASAYIAAIGTLDECPEVLANWSSGAIDFPPGAPQELIHARLAIALGKTDAAASHRALARQIATERAALIRDTTMRSQFLASREPLLTGSNTPAP
ncbi:MAG: tetratricopeptide repeat protein [Planctomycetota bacterium]